MLTMDQITTIISALFSPTVLWTALISFFVYYFIRGHTSRVAFSKLPQPGPKLALLGHSLLLQKKGVHITESSFNAFYKFAVEFHEHGLFAFNLRAQPIVHIFSAEYCEKLLTSTTHINKSTTYNPMLSWLGTGLIVSGGEKWRKDRKTLTPVFHYKIMDEFNPLFNKHARILCKKIQTTLYYEITDCVSTLSSCVLDTICETSMGVDLRTQTEEQGENHYCKSFVEFNCLSKKRTLYTFANQNNLFYSLTRDYWRSKRMINNMHDFTSSIINQRKEELESTTEKDGQTKLRSLLDLMLDIHLNDDSLSLQDIEHQLDNFVFAGYDTVSNGIAFTLACLANYTDIQQRVRTEVNEVIGNGDNEISSEHLSKFSYLEMVINESLRVYPPVPFSGRHLSEDFTLGEHVIPKGTDLWLNYFALHHNPTYWPEPETFNPERFSVENSAGRHPFAFLPFSAGQRNCIGQRYAKAFMKIVIAQIVSRFEIIPVTKIDDLTLAFELTIKTTKPIQLKFKNI